MKINPKNAPKFAALIAKLDKAGVPYMITGTRSNPTVESDGYILATSEIWPLLGETYKPNPNRIRHALKGVKA